MTTMNARFDLSGSGLRLIAAGDPLWQDLRPDASKAYVGFEICKALPHVAGPEMHGRHFGFHPQVLAQNHQKLLHQQTNLGHALAAYGAYRDRIVGTVVGVAFPANYGRRWELAESPEAAPAMQCVAVLHKRAEGVARLIGNHQSSKEVSSVSIEASSTELHIYDPGDRSISPITEAVEKYGGAVQWSEKEGWQAGEFEGRQLAFAPGGTNGSVEFEGVGYVARPADSAARITNIRAVRAETEHGLMLAAMAPAEWEPGDEVCWTPILAGRDAGRATVLEVITEGRCEVGGRMLEADAQFPILRLKVAGRAAEILRSAASVKKSARKS